MNRRSSLTISTRLDAPAADVWEVAISFDGINDEFRPLLKMTAPREVQELGIADVRTGERICRSWILLFRLIPVDYDDLVLERVGPGHEFHERSTMLTQRLWWHDRVIEADGDEACIVNDTVSWEPRLPIPGALLRPVFLTVFRYRHHRLKRRWSG